MPAARRGPELTGARFALAVLVLAAFAVLLRCVFAWPLVFPAPGRVMLVDSDSYFHLRHARHAMQHFPQIFRVDDAWGYPGLEQGEGAGLFDVFTGGLARLAAGGRTDDDLTLERVCAVVPLVVLVAVIGVLALGARWLVGPALALWVVAAFIAYPGTGLSVTLLGYCDHHVAEMLCSLASALALARLFDVSARPGVTAGRLWMWALAAAQPLVVFMFTWVGAGLWVPLLALGGMGVLALDVARGGPEDPAYRARAHAWAAYAVCALVCVTVLVRLVPSLTMAQRALNLGQVALAGTALCAWLHPPAARAATRRGWSPRGVALLGIAIPLAIVFCGLASVSAGRDLMSYLLTPKSTRVSEHKVIEPGLLWLVWGLPAVPALAALPLVVRRARVDAHGSPRIVPVICGLGIALLWLMTRDYSYQSVAFFPLLAGIGFDELKPLVPRWHGRGAVLLAAIVLIPFLPVNCVMHPWMSTENVANLMEVDPGWLEAAAWLRDKTPPSGLPLLDVPPGQPPPHPNYGVASRWDRGNLIVSKAYRRAVWARFPTQECGKWFVQTGEKLAIAALCPFCEQDQRVRYVVVDAQSVAQKFISMVLLSGASTDAYRASAGALDFEGRRYAPATYGRRWRNAVSVKLYYMDGDDLTRHRLVFESEDRFSHYFLVKDELADVVRMAVPVRQAALKPGQVARIPGGIAHDVSEHAAAKVFEVVKGAVLVGVAAPGAPVEILVAMQAVNTGRQFAQVRRIQAGPDGRWKQRVPYASKTAADAMVRGLAPYRVRWLDSKGVEVSKNIDVTDADVVQGRTVTVP